MSAAPVRAAAGIRRGDLICCIGFGACSAAGAAWFWLTAVGPTLFAW